MHPIRPLLVLFSLATLLPPTLAHAATPAYKLIDLGQDSTAVGINNAGTVAGIYYPGNSSKVSQLFLWTENTGRQNLGKIAGNAHGVTNAINVSGQIAGYYSFDDNQSSNVFLWTMKVGLNNLGSLRGNSFTTGLNNSGAIVGYDYANGPILLLNEALYEAFIWTAKTGFVNLGNLSLSLGDQTPFNLAHPSVYASAVNNAVQVVGSSNSRAFIWTAGGGMQDLGSLTGNNVTTSNAAAINDASQVVGYAGTTAGSSHAFLWTASGGMQDLGTLTGNASSYSQANAINAAGQVIGTSGAAGNTTHAFLWTSGGGMKDLGVLPGSVGSSADLINATGQIIGLSDTGKTDSNGNEIEVPFLWTAKKGMQALTGLIGRTAWKLQEIDGINDSGVIAGTGINPQGQTHAFVLAPLPAPSITTQPASATINIGATVTFTVIAQGAPPLSYQWQKNGANLTGATKPTLTINNATTASAGNYRVIVSNAAGSIASASARLLVRPATK